MVETDYVKKLKAAAYKKGFVQGMVKGAFEIALNMLNEEWPDEQITKYTGLKAPTLDNLRELLQDAAADYEKSQAATD